MSLPSTFAADHHTIFPSYAWHGKVEEALERFSDVEMLMYNFEESYPKFKALEKVVCEFQGYMERNAGMIHNYGEYGREGQVISTALVESLVNSFLSQQFTKKQPMPWTKRGAHWLLQTRAKVIYDEWETVLPARQASSSPSVSRGPVV